MSPSFLDKGWSALKKESFRAVRGFFASAKSTKAKSTASLGERPPANWASSSIRSLDEAKEDTWIEVCSCLLIDWTCLETWKCCSAMARGADG
jgi:hypothetical protein